ncbi:Flagellar hook-basal body complex protein FliE [Caloramator mitchellensis]|uniref:Flagellar hook-basal body complex protein FliE n=1 Tax=Caloramator mitchellensis TaxID=908809 RepID=A0A0R3K262_CALMK|nr:flagellar hook-basal body complex protein FliE [Caloramator mitchellensis]KRQ87061.1 Flagellar hook-basal body complex protein FliE [Caloramator mitchellensis]
MEVNAIATNMFNNVHKTNSVQNNTLNFENFLKDALDKVNEKQIEAEKATMDLVTGQAQDIHQVMITTEEARLTLELAVQIRNKLVDAYQELMRMQI